MKSKYMAALIACALMLIGGAPSNAQNNPPSSDKPAEKNEKQQPGTPAAPAANAEEDAAFKAYSEAPAADADALMKKAQLGEDFAKKYPQSRYNQAVYSSLTTLYYSAGQVQKMLEAGGHAVEINPSDVQVMAILAQTMPRVLSKDHAEALKQVGKAEQYARKVLEVTPTMPKPAALSEEAFAGAKNVVLAMAHGGLGHICVLKQKYDEAIKNLEEAIKIDPQPDPVNFYLLGVADEKASHFDDAVAAFNKCAAIPGQLQPSCKSSAEEAKKLASTQLSAPK